MNEIRYIDSDKLYVTGSRGRITRRLIHFESKYDPFKNATTISIKDDKGKALISAEIYSMLTEPLIQQYASELCLILIRKGVIKHDR